MTSTASTHIIIPQEEQLLGKGSYSQVIAAEFDDGRQTSPVALKIIHKEVHDCESFFQQKNDRYIGSITAEVDALRTLKNSQYIVQLRQVFTPKDNESKISFSIDKATPHSNNSSNSSVKNNRVSMKRRLNNWKVV